MSEQNNTAAVATKKNRSYAYDLKAKTAKIIEPDGTVVRVIEYGRFKTSIRQMAEAFGFARKFANYVVNVKDKSRHPEFWNKLDAQLLEGNWESPDSENQLLNFMREQSDANLKLFAMQPGNGGKQALVVIQERIDAERAAAEGKENK